MADSTIYCPDCRHPLHLCGAHTGDGCEAKSATTPITDENTATEPERIQHSALLQVASISAIGLVAATALHKDGICVLQLGEDGFLEFAPAQELPLDDLPEPDALLKLVSMDYSDQQMASYLKQRERRNYLKSIIANR